MKCAATRWRIEVAKYEMEGDVVWVLALALAFSVLTLFADPEVKSGLGISDRASCRFRPRRCESEKVRK